MRARAWSRSWRSAQPGSRIPFRPIFPTFGRTGARRSSRNRPLVRSHGPPYAFDWGRRRIDLTSDASAIPLEPGAAAETIAVEPTTLSSETRSRILAYLSVLILLLGFGSPTGGLIDVPISFFLKNKLHLSAHQVAEFRLVAGIPLYLSIVFGLTRDTWNPFGMRDRGYMVLFGAITAVLFVLFAFMPFNEPMLLGAMI